MTAPTDDVTARAPDMAEPPGPGTAVRYFGHYELLDNGRAGGMGMVFRARQTTTGRIVALKLLKADCLGSADTVRRFHLEVEAATRLDHPCILPIYEVGEHRGQHYYTMRFVAAGSLDEQLERGQWRLDGVPNADRRERQCAVARMLQQVAEALHHAHQRGILHRDLKPGNLLIDDEGHPFVADFGIAKFLGQDSGLTRTEVVLGSPQYMAPEQAAGGTSVLTTAADVFSLGVVFYQLLAGRLPFQADSLVGLARAVAEQEPRPPRDANPPVDRDLETICLKCLEKEPERRYGTAGEVAAELGRWLRGEPILGRTATIWERGQKWARRNPIAAVLAGLALLLTIGGTVGIEVNRREAVLQRTRAEQTASAETRERQRAENALIQVQLGQADDWLSQDRASEAVALLASVVRRQPTHRLACERLLCVLAQQRFRRAPLVEFDSPGGLRFADWSPGGDLVVTASWQNHLAQTWDAASGEARSQPMRHEGEITSAAFSPDGSRVVTTSTDRTARIWDARTGQPLTPYLRHSNEVACAAFSPQGDRVATASKDGTAALWRTDGSDQSPLRLPHSQAVTRVFFGPTGDEVLTTTQDGTLRVWNARTAAVASLCAPASPWHLAFAHTTDGWQVLTSSITNARVWAVRTGKPVGEPMGGPYGVHRATFAPDGLRMAIAAADGTIQIWNSLTAKAQARTIFQDGETLDAVMKVRMKTEPMAFCPDGSLLKDPPQEHMSPVMDLDTFTEVGKALLPGGGAFRIHSVAFSPDGLRLATASEDHTARIWDATSGHLLAGPFEHSHEAYGAVFSPDGRRLLTWSGDHTVRIWDARISPGPPWPLIAGSPGSVVVPSPDRSRVAVADDRGGVALVDTSSGRSSGSTLQHSRPVTDVAFSADGSRLATLAGDRVTQVWDLRTGTPCCRPFGHDTELRKLSLSPKGDRLLTTTADHRAAVWETESHRLLAGPVQLPGAVCQAGFFGQSERVIARAGDRAVQVWDLRRGQPESAPLAHEWLVAAAVFNPDGLRVATASATSAWVWDVSSGKKTTPPLSHLYAIEEISFSPDGQRFITGDLRGTVRIWDAQTGVLLLPSLAHENPILQACFSPDGTRFLTVSGGEQPFEKTLRVWDTATGRLVAGPIRPLSGDGLIGCDFSPQGDRVLSLDRHQGFAVLDLPAGVEGAEQLADAAEGMFGRRLSERGVIEPPDWTHARQQTETVKRWTATNGSPLARWLAWCLADPEERTVSPRSSLRHSEYVARLLQSGEADEILPALATVPDHALLAARLAQQILEWDNPSAEWLATADCLSQHSARLAPRDLKVWQVRAAVLQARAKTNEADIAREQIEKLAQRHP